MVGLILASWEIHGAQELNRILPGYGSLICIAAIGAFIFSPDGERLERAVKTFGGMVVIGFVLASVLVLSS
jgi:hypothetical protein